MSFIYTVTGYEKKFNDKLGHLFDSVEIIVHAENENDAIARAKQMITKKHYRIARVEEGHDLRDEMAMAQLEMNKKFLDKLK